MRAARQIRCAALFVSSSAKTKTEELIFILAAKASERDRSNVE